MSFSTAGPPRYDTFMYPTLSSDEQLACEDNCALFFSDPVRFPGPQRQLLFNEDNEVKLLRSRHVDYLMRGLHGLNQGYSYLEASRPWLCYWILHSLDILDSLPRTVTGSTIDFLRRCQNQSGGFGGGPQQISHCAPTYASTLSLLILGTPEAYKVINRKQLYSFFLRMKHECGGFRMHEHGEIDVRGTYTVIAVADLLNILTPELADGVAEFVGSCQTYEGGIGGEPGNEAHGGYAFCAVAALSILDRLDTIDVPSLAMSFEGGFQGRTNKLVDGCYSFWQGSTFALLPEDVEAVRSSHAAGSAPFLHAGCGPLGGEGEPTIDTVPSDGGGRGAVPGAATPEAAAFIERSASKGSIRGVDSDSDCEVDESAVGDMLLDAVALQQYILRCCQQLEGGLRDKPGKPRDHYHTCYCLSGLSLAQHTRQGARAAVHGDGDNAVACIHPAYNIRREKIRAARAYFSGLPSDHEYLTS